MYLGQRPLKTTFISYVSKICLMTRRMPLTSMDKIMRHANANRVSDSAKEKLRECLEEEAKKLVLRADQLSKHAGRTTIMKEDVELASKK
jgi:histone H3/H4